MSAVKDIYPTLGKQKHHLWRVKRIFVFEHSVMTNFNCACPAILKGQGSGLYERVAEVLARCT